MTFDSFSILLSVVCSGKLTSIDSVGSLASDGQTTGNTRSNRHGKVKSVVFIILAHCSSSCCRPAVTLKETSASPTAVLSYSKLALVSSDLAASQHVKSSG